MNDWSDAERRVEKAQQFFEQRKWSDALREIRVATDINPHNASWFFNMGLILDEMGRFEEALQAYFHADGIVGGVSGFVGGSTGLAGIPVVIWSTLRGWSKDEQRAVFQPVAIAIFAMVLVWFAGSGMVTAETVRLFVIGLPAVLLGMWLGLRLYGKLNEAAFRTVVLVLLLISGGIASAQVATPRAQEAPASEQNFRGDRLQSDRDSALVPAPTPAPRPSPPETSGQTPRNSPDPNPRPGEEPRPIPR